MKTIHLAIQEDQDLMMVTQDEFDFDEMLGITCALLQGVMERAAGDNETLRKELYSRVNYRISSLLTEFLPDVAWLTSEPSESTPTK